MLRETEAEVVLLDIRLPDLDGLKVLERIVSQPAAPPTIILFHHCDVSNTIFRDKRIAVSVESRNAF